MSEPTSHLPADRPVDPELTPGQLVGEYVVDGKLGEGAFGMVFRATHPLIGKVVAIKVLSRRFSVDHDMVSRFIAEARAVNQIRHRHIIDIFSFGTLDDGRQYYVMEYLDGEPLDALLDRHGKLPLAEALPILRGLARALDAAHAKGIAHRDVKAENVFLASDPDGGVFPKLLDFGIAKLLAPDDGLKHKTRTGTPVGTPYYMSPEQCRGRDVDHRTDCYAFGVLAYLMLTGSYPHDAEDYMSILMRHISEEPAPPSTRAPELPAGIDAAILQLLDKDPAARPASLRAAMNALEAAAEGVGVSVGTSTWEVQSGPVARVETGPVVATPKAPSKPPVSNAWASAPTVMPATASSGGQPSVPATPTVTTEAAAPARARTALWIGAGAIVVGAVVVLVLQPWRRAPEAAPPAPVHVESVPAPVPAPAPPAPPPDLEPPPVPVEAQTVIVDVQGVPEGTEVYVGGMIAGAAPGPVQLPRDTHAMVLTFKVDGYLPTSRTITPDRDQPLVLALKKKPGGTGGKRPVPTKDDIIDIFEKKP